MNADQRGGRPGWLVRILVLQSLYVKREHVPTHGSYQALDPDGTVRYSHLGAVTEPVVIHSIIGAVTTAAARAIEGRDHYETALAP